MESLNIALKKNRYFENYRTKLGNGFSSNELLIRFRTFQTRSKLDWPPDLWQQLEFASHFESPTVD